MAVFACFTLGSAKYIDIMFLLGKFRNCAGRSESLIVRVGNAGGYYYFFHETIIYYFALISYNNQNPVYPVSEARSKFGVLVDRVSIDKTILVTKQGKIKAALVDYDYLKK